MLDDGTEVSELGLAGVDAERGRDTAGDRQCVFGAVKRYSTWRGLVPSILDDPDRQGRLVKPSVNTADRDGRCGRHCGLSGTIEVDILMSQGPQGPPGVVIPGIEFSQLAVDEDGNVYLDAMTHYGITAEGVGYYEDDP